MVLYKQMPVTAVTWPEPLESIWQWLPPDALNGISKVPHLSLSDELFIAAVANIPRPARPWGAISWMAETFNTSRSTVYSLGQRVSELLQMSPSLPLLTPLPSTTLATSALEITNERMMRTMLTSAFPGKVALRPMQAILQEAFGQTLSVGTLSQELSKAGQRAGEILHEVDHGPLGPVIVLRDETYFQGWPFLLVIEPVSSVILLAEVSADCGAETWGAALLVAQDQGATIAGLVEDMASMYSLSMALAEVDVDVQKDPWHVIHLGGRVRRTLQREAFAAMRQADKLEKGLLKRWKDAVFFEQYIPAVTKMEQLIEQHDTFAEWFVHLCDALELVDWRSGEIRDRATNGWLLDETLQALAHINHQRVRSFVKTLRHHQGQLLTCLDWLAVSLQGYEQLISQQINDLDQRQHFIKTAARCWRLRQARISQPRRWQKTAQAAEAALQALTQDDQILDALANHLMTLLDAAGHTSSLIECVNGILKSFLKNRRAFRNLDTAQTYLNLFVLWHNMRVYERGKRAGQSPYQLAGIDVGSDDWLTLLGYPDSDN